MTTRSQELSQGLKKIPSPLYLWAAILIFAASNSITRQLTHLGEQHLVNGRNPISLCNVLFVGNLCALLVMLLLFSPQLPTLKGLKRKDWLSLTLIAILSGALGPALIFSALDRTNVTNVVLIGRLEPPIALFLSILLLKVRVGRLTIAGSLICFAGVFVTASFNHAEVSLGRGELLAALGATVLAIAGVISQLHLKNLPLGVFSVFRTGVGAIVFFILANLLYSSEHFAEAFSPFLWGWMLIYGTGVVVIGQLFWFAGLRETTPAQVTLVSSFYPIAAVVMAYLILGEIPTVAQYLGGSLILLGILLNWLGTRQPAKIQYSTAKSMSMMVGFRGI
jgi:drug/metabolite transporter (DMT)-like permease